MAKTSVVARSKKTPKFSSRQKNRCFRCGRGNGFMRDFGVCRICFRELANEGMLPEQMVEVPAAVPPTEAGDMVTV